MEKITFTHEAWLGQARRGWLGKARIIVLCSHTRLGLAWLGLARRGRAGCGKARIILNNQGETQMSYNINNAKEIKTDLPKDTVLNGVIIDIKSGAVLDFISDSAKEKWQGDVYQPAINCKIEVTIDDYNKEKRHTYEMFTYNEDENGTTCYTTRSNMGKFKKKYGFLPNVGQVVKIITNSDGRGKVMLE